MKYILLAMLSMLTCCSKPTGPAAPLPHYDMLPGEKPRAQIWELPKRKPGDPNDIADALNRAENAALEARDLVTPKEAP